MIVVGAFVTSAAQGDLCGDQGQDNRPNHCEVLVDEVWVHQMSRCDVLEPGKCQYTHCSGSKRIYEEEQCCCLESQTCPGAKYVGLCVGGHSSELPAAAAESFSTPAAPGSGKGAVTTAVVDGASTPSTLPSEQVNKDAVPEVKMWCEVTDSGHRVRVTYTNSGAEKKCTSNCRHKNDQGNSGVLKCEVALQSKVTSPSLFCDVTDGVRSFTVTDPGSFSCK